MNAGAPEFSVRREFDRGLIWTVAVSALVHAVCVGLLIAMPQRFLSAPPKLQSYTVDLVAPNVVGGTNLVAGGRPANPAAPPPPVAIAHPPAPAVEAPPKPAALVVAPPAADVAPVEPAKPPEPPKPPVEAKAPDPVKVVEPPKPAAVKLDPESKAAPLIKPPPPKPAPEPPKAQEPAKPEAVAAQPKPVEKAPPAKPVEPKVAAKPAEAAKPAAVKPAAPAKPAENAKPAAPVETAAEREARQREQQIADAVQRRAAQVQNGQQRDQQIAAAVQRRAGQVGTGGTRGAAEGGGPISVGPGSGAGGTPMDLEFILYQGKMEERIKTAWAWAGAARNLRAVVQFNISPAGEIANVRTIESSGDAQYDASCERAVRAANPLAPVPEKYRDTFATVEMTFKPDDVES